MRPDAVPGGQSIGNITEGAIDACRAQGFVCSFSVFNRYADPSYPTVATGAFCALHKGLDAADTTAYPEDRLGQADRTNIDRMTKIVAHYERYGAAVDDRNGLRLDQVRQRDTQKGFNDVGWQIWPENYSRFLYQIDPDETSVPRWRVGGPLTKSSSLSDRLARGFEHAAGKDALYFKLHDEFSADHQPKTRSIHALWYDGQAGSTWKLVSGAGRATIQTALSVTGTGDRK